MTKVATRRLTTLSLLLAAVLVVPSMAHAVLERVGPTLPVAEGGYPAWYQDTSGLVLEFCSPSNQFELDNGLCLLLPGDTVAPENFAAGEGFFSGEHFYWAAEAVGDHTGGSRALLVLALEAAFGLEAPIDGTQAVFGRLRIRIDDVPVSGNYTFYTPFGKFVHAGAAGDRIFATIDDGCFAVGGVAGDYSCALQATIGPFLVGSSIPGGDELPPVEFPEVPGKKYLAHDGPVTNGWCAPAEACDANGDYITTDGPRNPNIFRVEGPDGTAIFETTTFSVTGRLFDGEIPGRVTADRASYARTAGSQKIDTYATAFPTRQARIPGTPIIEPEAPILAMYSAPCNGALAEDGTVLPPFSAPAGTPVPMAQNGTVYFAQSKPAVIPTHVCLAHTNARNTSGQIAPVYFNVRLGDQVSIASANYNTTTKTLTVVASSSDLVDQPQLTVAGFGNTPDAIIPLDGTVVIPAVDAPPHAVTVRSAQQGSNTMQVETGVRPASGVTLSASVPSPQTVGTAVVFTAAGQGAAGYEYRFLVRKPGSTVYEQVQGYSPTATWTMPSDPTNYPVGDYRLVVDVRTSTSVLRDAQAGMVYTLSAPIVPATGVTVAASPASPQLAGTPVVFLAAGAGSSNYQYRFLLRKPNTTVYVEVQPYSSQSSWTMPADAVNYPPGSYRLVVDVRTTSSVVRDVQGAILYTLQ